MNADEIHKNRKPLAKVSPTKAVSAVTFQSNPFRATLTGLTKMFTYNPVPTLVLGLVLVAIMVGVLVCVGIAILLGILTAKSIIGPVLFGLLSLAGIVAAVALSTGSIVAVQSASYKGFTITINQALSAFGKKRFLRLCVAQLLTGLIVFGGFLLLIVPGVILAARFILAPFIILNENKTAVESLRRSWQLTRGHTWEMMGAYFAQILVIGTSGGLLSFVGGNAAITDRYFTLVMCEADKIPTGPTHSSNYILVVLMLIFAPLYIAGSVAANVWSLKMEQKDSKHPAGITQPFFERSFNQNSAPTHSGAATEYRVD